MNTRHFPLIPLVAASLLTGAVCIWLGWTAYDASRLVETTLQQDFRFKELEGDILHWDEVLTMSARMAATTGNARWEERYREFEPQLDAAIKEAVRLSPNAVLARNAAQTDEANAKLVAMENRAFALVRDGEAEQARAVLFSNEYEEQKKIYADGLRRLVATMDKEMGDAFDGKRSQIWFSISGAMGALIVTLIVWLVAVRSVRHWRAALERAVTERTEAEQATRRANDELEMRVTERTAELGKTNETLRESDEKFHQLANNITDVFWMTSPDLQQIHYVSPAYEQVWGRTAERLYAHPQEWPDAILPEDRERIFTTFGRLSKDESTVSEEFRIVRPDGEVRWILSRGFQVRDAVGDVIRFAGVATDITERKRVEAQLFQSQKMETVGKLAGGVAHEFNSILTAIIGQSELLMGDLPAGSSMAKGAIEINKAAGRAATLTRQLLAYGRKQILQPEILDLNQVITGMEGMVQHLMGDEVDTQIVPAPDLRVVKADVGQIEQVIMNMAINAREAMPNGGKLTLETSNISFDEESVGGYPELKVGDYVMLAITDTGAGMSEEIRAHVFEPFFSTKKIGQGTGLGLSTCHGIIKQSGGHISVYSEPGRGTTFKIYLPQMKQERKIPTPRPNSPNLPRGTETILLAEDDPALLEMATTLLRRLGYRVLSAANGVEALNVKNRRDIGHIDLLFTDVVMPHMSGKELADRMRKSYPHTKILFTSAYAENAIVHQGVLDEGVTLLQKPFTPSALARKVREVLDAKDPATEGRLITRA